MTAVAAKFCGRGETTVVERTTALFQKASCSSEGSGSGNHWDASLENSTEGISSMNSAPGTKRAKLRDAKKKVRKCSSELKI